LREVTPSDVPLLPAKEFLKEYLLSGDDSVKNLIEALRKEVEAARERLSKSEVPCEDEKIASVITLKAVEFAMDVVEGLKNYDEGKEVDLDKVLVALEGLLGLIRASGSRALPESIREVLSKCCEKDRSFKLKS